MKILLITLLFISGCASAKDSKPVEERCYKHTETHKIIRSSKKPSSSYERVACVTYEGYFACGQTQEYVVDSLLTKCGSLLNIVGGRRGFCPDGSYQIIISYQCE